MAGVTTNTVQLSAPLRARVDAFFTALGQGLNAYIETRSRSAELQRLFDMSDAELARIGLTRDGIVAHVFRDRLGF